VIAEINARTGAGLELIGLDDQTGGTSSAAYARHRATGAESAITRTSASLAEMLLTASVLDLARSAGCPVPRHLHTVELADGYVAVVQERLPGKRPRRVDADTVDAMVAVNDQFAGLLNERGDIPGPAAFAPPRISPWNATLGRYSSRSRRLMDHCHAGGSSMMGNDLVHLDYSLGNVLYDTEHHVSGVVDWNRGVARGDRWYALIGTQVNMTAEAGMYGVTNDAIDRIDQILNTELDEQTSTQYRARWYLDNAHRSIRGQFPADRIEQDLDLVEQHQA
jgi:aminoglycoside phosphotransferase (APT) family kinase protein